MRPAAHTARTRPSGRRVVGRRETATGAGAAVSTGSTPLEMKAGGAASTGATFVGGAATVVAVASWRGDVDDEVRRAAATVVGVPDGREVPVLPEDAAGFAVVV